MPCDSFLCSFACNDLRFGITIVEVGRWREAGIAGIAGIVGGGIGVICGIREYEALGMRGTLGTLEALEFWGIWGTWELELRGMRGKIVLEGRGGVRDWG